eukprot:1540435-Pyramimonas_sp.AAC.1
MTRLSDESHNGWSSWPPSRVEGFLVQLRDEQDGQGVPVTPQKQRFSSFQQASTYYNHRLHHALQVFNPTHKDAAAAAAAAAAQKEQIKNCECTRTERFGNRSLYASNKIHSIPTKGQVR